MRKGGKFPRKRKRKEKGRLIRLAAGSDSNEISCRPMTCLIAALCLDSLSFIHRLFSGVYGSEYTRNKLYKSGVSNAGWSFQCK